MNEEAAIVVAVVVAACVSAAIASLDQRSLRAPSSVVATFPTTTFEDALAAPDTSWFRKKLRCDIASFLRIYQLVADACDTKPAPNSTHSLMKRVALTMLYLAQGGTQDSAAAVLGISKTRAVVYIQQILDILDSMSKEIVRMPTTEEQDAVEAQFYAIAGFPGVIGAIDGTLIEIPRPNDYEGWYSRKNFPALNVQAVVDASGAFRSISIRSGSTNDQSLWNGSGLRKKLATHIHPGKHLVGDAGYKIWRHLLTPFPEAETVHDPQKARYNKAHSKTRMVVECAFGILKNRFRILLGKLELKTTEQRCKLIKGCAVLHNLMLSVSDSQQIDGDDPHLAEASSGSVGDDPEDHETQISHEQGRAKRSDISSILAGRF